MKYKISIILLIAVIFTACGELTSITKKYKEAEIKKLCIFADFESREIRKHLERKLAQYFKESTTEAFESYVLIPKTTPFTNREMKKKLEELKIDHYLYITRLNEGEGVAVSEEPFIEFGQLKGEDGPISYRPQIAAKVTDATGDVIWTSAIEIEKDAEAEFPLNEEIYMNELFDGMLKAKLLAFENKPLPEKIAD